jgi:hypothetical protein
MKEFLQEKVAEVVKAAEKILPSLWGPTPEEEVRQLNLGRGGGLAPTPEGGWRIHYLIDHINLARACLTKKEPDLAGAHMRLQDAREHLTKLIAECPLK